MRRIKRTKREREELYEKKKKRTNISWIPRLIARNNNIRRGRKKTKKSILLTNNSCSFLPFFLCGYFAIKKRAHKHEYVNAPSLFKHIIIITSASSPFFIHTLQPLPRRTDGRRLHRTWGLQCCPSAAAAHREKINTTTSSNVQVTTTTTWECPSRIPSFRIYRVASSSCSFFFRGWGKEKRERENDEDFLPTSSCTYYWPPFSSFSVRRHKRRRRPILTVFHGSFVCVCDCWQQAPKSSKKSGEEDNQAASEKRKREEEPTTTTVEVIYRAFEMEKHDDYATEITNNVSRPRVCPPLSLSLHTNEKERTNVIPCVVLLLLEVE